MIRVLKPFIFSMVIFSCSYGCDNEKLEKIDKFYARGLSIVDDYRDLESVLSNYEEAYSNFENAAKLGHVASMYHLGFLHETAACYGNMKDSKSIAENLSKASHYYGICAVYDFPKAEEALIRVVLEASKKIKNVEDKDTKNLSLEHQNQYDFSKQLSSYSLITNSSGGKSHID